MKKSLKLSALICAAVLILCGCGAEQVVPPLNHNAIIVETVKYSDVYGHYIQYSQLTSVEKHCYGIVYTAVRDHLSEETEIQDTDGNSIPGIRISLANSQLTLEQISRVFDAFHCDNPAFFFIDRTYSLEGREINGSQTYDTLQLRYTMNASQRTQATKQLNDAVQNILKDCPATDDEYLAELYLHDKLLSICTYDQSATETPDTHPNAYSSYGALVDGKAVCEGYAKAMQLLLSSVSIPATTVRGCSADNQTGHMWNLVNINGQYYYLDPTWNDNETLFHYSYFNITSQSLQRTHTIDNKALFITDCTAETDNYFIRNNAYITTYDRDRIADAIAAQIRNGAAVVHLRFEDSKFENGLLFLKNATLVKKMVNARLSEGMQMWNYELSAPADQNTLSLRKI